MRAFCANAKASRPSRQDTTAPQCSRLQIHYRLIREIPPQAGLRGVQRLPKQPHQQRVHLLGRRPHTTGTQPPKDAKIIVGGGGYQRRIAGRGGAVHGEQTTTLRMQKPSAASSRELRVLAAKT
ncbi:uncharacterized protein Tco025E_08076 [Trypanosoma conorhini]|uniref:Uncharacterized protein n=1 Tax=Trypanosoma conorhini TaxID=83891 RepID=A0A422NEQ3_9TRYP|nr:uncharacterized protein Tco025E_08076 [Trypanosoma conorhini]RNF03938.1 hypothetical protein Tco025E_08076 [Trypanosoma conorhini]